MEYDCHYVNTAPRKHTNCEFGSQFATATVDALLLLFAAQSKCKLNINNGIHCGISSAIEDAKTSKLATMMP